MVAAEVDPERLVFVDEMGVHTSLAPLYGYSAKGERVRLSVPRNRGKNTTLLAAMTLDGMGQTMAVEGSTDQEVFDAYVEHVLAPTLETGQVVILDNLSAHKPARMRELIECRGCQLIYLPSYSLDFNPIEEAFAKIKNILRQAGARTKDALVEVYWAKRSRRSAPKTPEVTSSMPAIVHEPNYCETCCRSRAVGLRQSSGSQ
jgi:transposase